MTNIRDFALEVDNAARDFENRGWKKVIVPFGTKGAKSTAWQNSDPKPDVFRKGAHNIGVQLGLKSGGLIDIDLDCPQAMLLADQFFPELTDAAFGRLRQDGTHVLGHRLVMCPDIPEKEDKVRKYQLAAAAESEAVKPFGFPKGVLVELRAGGGYTGFPPSWYPIDDDKPGPDEKLTWRHRGATALVPEIPVMPFTEVKRRVGLLAFASLCLAAYPVKGGRDEFCLKLAGALIHAGLEPGKADNFIVMIAEAANDEDWRGEKALRTKMKADEGEQVNGLPAFLEAYGLAACEKTVRKWLGMEAKTNEAKAGKAPAEEPDKECSIIIGVDELKAQATMIARKFREANIPLFRRDIEVLRIHRFPVATKEGEITYAANSTVLRPNDWRWIRTEVDTLIKYYIKSASGDYRQVHPPLDSIQTLGDRIADLGLPELVGMTHVPTLDRDEPGYDPVTKIYHAYNKADFPKVPEKPTRNEALAALARLLNHARAFPWKSDVDKAVYVAFLLTAVIRASIAFAPVFGFSARDPRSGKSKLAKCGGWLATGSEPATASFMGNKYNDTQAYWATLSSGAYMILYDNLEVGLPFYNDAIAQGLQSAHVRARVLGESRTVLLPTRTLMAVTGNDLTSKKDMVERMLRCELDPKTDKPGERVFDFDPELEMLGDRAGLVVDALTIMRAYQMCGERVKVAKAMGGFEEWSRLVREAVIWLGLGDPLGSIKSLREDDESGAQDVNVLAALWPRFKGGAWFTVSQVGANEHTKRLLLPMCRNGRWENLGYVLRAATDRERGGVVLRRVRDEGLGQFKFKIEGEPTEQMMLMIESMDFVPTGQGLVVSGSGGLAVSVV